MTFEELIKNNHLIIKKEDGTFIGNGWDYLKENVNVAKNVLVGEDHFLNEIPELLDQLMENIGFDNFHVEIDPYSLKIVENSFGMNDDKRVAFNKLYSDIFSFFAKKAEYDFLKKMYEKGSNLLGADQIVMNADKLILDTFIDKVDERTTGFLRTISEKSAIHFSSFLENPSENKMYMMDDEYPDVLTKLEECDISDDLRQIVSDLKLSRKIYLEQNHALRVKLLLNQLMKDYNKWKDKKNLFKYGANHMARGESFLYVHDIGNMVANISKSQFETSFHIMMVAQTGEQSTAFRTFPNSKINPDRGFYLKYLKPFFAEMNDKDKIHVFNLQPLRNELIRNKLNLDDINLIRAIKGFDALVIFPEGTPSQHFVYD